jgi:hypothetical protein
MKLSIDKEHFLNVNNACFAGGTNVKAINITYEMSNAKLLFLSIEIRDVWIYTVVTVN